MDLYLTSNVSCLLRPLRASMGSLHLRRPMSSHRESQLESCPVHFSPHLWKQRRALALASLLKAGSRSVLDVGCGEGAFLEILANEAVFTKLAGMDVDESALDKAARRCWPTQMDRRCLRELPLEVDLFRGSVRDADPRCQGFEAVVCLEVIEHLTREVLALFPGTVFGVYRPPLVIVSTPNAEFNAHFPNLRYGTSQAQFRHEDHKFEWTRQEFQDWCQQIATQYGYAVSFSGVGKSPKGSPLDTGFCSQFGIFKRRSAVDFKVALPKVNSYDLVYGIDYPYYEDEHPDELEILRELLEIINNLFYQKLHSERFAKTQVAKTGTGFTVSCDEVWGVLRTRQLCKTKTRLLQVLAVEEAKVLFSVDPDSNEILCRFKIKPLESTDELMQDATSTPEELPDLMLGSDSSNGQDSTMSGWSGIESSIEAEESPDGWGEEVYSKEKDDLTQPTGW